LIWFKHDANAATDAKIKKLLIKYGTDGYAIYFHCLELIVSDISETNITFELEHDCEIIADDLKIKGTAEQSGQERVNEIMRYIISLGLFEENNGKIFCYKVLKRLDTSMTSNPRMRKLIVEGKSNHALVMTGHDGVMQDKKRREEIRKEENKKEEKRHKYGEFQHILLTDKQYKELLNKVDDREKWIKIMDESIEEKGNIYKIKNFSVAIVKWYKKDLERNGNKKIQTEFEEVEF
jgi:hypothetical protein